MLNLRRLNMFAYMLRFLAVAFVRKINLIGDTYVMFASQSDGNSLHMGDDACIWNNTNGIVLVHANHLFSCTRNTPEILWKKRWEVIESLNTRNISYTGKVSFNYSTV